MVRAGTGCTVTPLSDSNNVGDDDRDTTAARYETAKSRQDVSGMDGAVDHLRVLLRQEREMYPPSDDYLDTTRHSSQPGSGLPPLPPSDRVSEAWRRKLCEWCYEVVDHFNFDREVVSIALNYLDRAVAIKAATSAEGGIPKREFQLLAVTSLYTAIKLHGETDTTDGPRRKLKIDAFVELSRGFFQVDVIEAMERQILEALEWHMNPPTSLRFVASLLRLCPKWDRNDHAASHANVVGGIYDVARYLTELSVCVSAFSFTCYTSVVAYASVLCAVEALQSSLPLPYAVRVAFLNNIAEATGLLPEGEEVRRVRDMIKELCPSMFEGDEIPPEFLVDRTANIVTPVQQHTPKDDRTSPVCVVVEAACAQHHHHHHQQNQHHHHQEEDEDDDDISQEDESPTRRKRSRTSNAQQVADPLKIQGANLHH